MDDQTYPVFAMCVNCGFKGKVTVPKGKEIKSQTCPNCQCAGMARTAEPELPKGADKREDLKKEEPVEEDI